MGGVTKKIKDMPKGVSALREMVQAHLVEGTDNDKSSSTATGFTIEYQDEDKDNIAILDDDDLLLAYEWAQQQANADLKLIITTQKKKKGKKYDPFAKDPQENPNDVTPKPRRGKKTREGDNDQDSAD
jgi:hypothetical protein